MVSLFGGALGGGAMSNMLYLWRGYVWLGAGRTKQDRRTMCFVLGWGRHGRALGGGEVMMQVSMENLERLDLLRKAEQEPIFLTSQHQIILPLMSGIPKNCNTA